MEQINELSHLDKKDWNSVIQEMVPNISAYSISSIEYSEIPYGELYPDSSGMVAQASCDEYGNVVFYPAINWSIESNSNEQSLKDFFSILQHEAAHAADWESAGHLTRTERLTLLDTVLDRIDAPNSYESPYLESIAENPVQGQKRLAKEYFAEIVEAYYVGTPDLPDADRELVENWIAKGGEDPERQRQRYFSIIEDLAKEENNE